MDPADDALSPAAFAELVRGASEEQLASGLAANREVVLTEIFRQMPASLDPAAAAGVDAIVEWRIDDDAWHVTIRDGRASVERGAAAEPHVVFAIGAVDFVRLVAGAVEGPELFMHGHLRVEGDLVLALRMPRLFRLP